MCSSDAHASSRSSSGRSLRRAPGAAPPSSSPERQGSARPGSPPSSGDGHVRRASRSCSDTRSISSARSCPYQPFVEALRPLGDALSRDRKTPGSQLGAFARTLELLTDRAAETPMLLVLEDLHWADVSTLDLVVFLAHNLDDQAVLLLATYRADELSSGERMWRLAEGARRSGLDARPRARPARARRADRLPWRSSRLVADHGREHDRGPVRGQPLLCRGAPRRCGDRQRRDPTRPPGPPPAARRPRRPRNPGGAATGCGGRS